MLQPYGPKCFLYPLIYNFILGDNLYVEHCFDRKMFSAMKSTAANQINWNSIQ